MKKLKQISSLLCLACIGLFFTACTPPQQDTPKPDAPTEYTATFYVQSDQKQSVEKTYESGTKVTTDLIQSDVFENTTQTKEGYINSQLWYTEDSYTNQVIFPYTLTKNESFYLKWNEAPAGEYYNITYYVDNSIYNTATVNKDQTITLIDDPTKEGHTFIGWYTDADFNTAFNATTAVTADISLYAKFDINTFDVTFYDGASVLDTDTVNYGAKATQPSNPTKTGYTFIGWYTDSSLATKFDFNTTITQATSIYAKFDIIKLDVTFYDGASVLGTDTVNYGAKATQPSNPTKTGYTFIGWYTDANLNTEFNFNTAITQATNIYAKFEANTPTPVEKFYVTYYHENTKLEKIQVNSGSLVTRPADPEAITGYTFMGWYTGTDYLEVFDFATMRITEDTSIFAYYKLNSTDPSATIEVVSYQGYKEGIYVNFKPVANAAIADYTVSYKLHTASSYTTIDQELIRQESNNIRVDILGLPSGEYDVKIDVKGSSTTRTLQSITVYEQDRSGYAHFNYTNGVGAYNDDGSLKSNAVVVYVTDATKNTVTAVIGGKTYTGLVNIVQACTKESYALNVRIIGEIQTTQWNSKSHGSGNTSARQTNLENAFKYTTDPSGWDETTSSNYSKLNAEGIISKGINSMSNDEAKGITALEGLTNQVLRDKTATSGRYEYDSYYNMLDVNGGYNITIEGVGTDAGIYQWGFNFKKCNSVEVKNLHFANYTEDALGFEGGSSSSWRDYGNYWVHNCTFDVGVNNWDVCYEADKGDGDGSTDFKYCRNVTISYTQYNKTHKTNLIGSSDSALQYNFTIHHTYYNQCGSRLPLLRQANVHFYNNYYFKTTSYCSSIRANAYGFYENNYYESSKNPYELVKTGTRKAIGNVYNNCTTSGSYVTGNTTTDRTSSASSTCGDDTTSFVNFDTNSTLFYYDSVNKKSDVSYLTSAEIAKTDCLNNSGVLKATYVGNAEDSNTPVDPVDPVEPTTWATAESNDFTSGTPTYSSTTPTAAGIYYSYSTNGTGSSELNNLSIENGQLCVNDNSTDTTYGYYMFNSDHSTGKVRVSIDFTPQTSNGKWTAIHFLDGNTNIGVRTDENKKLSYTLDGTNLTQVGDYTLTAGTTYKIILTIDFNADTATISINGSEVTISGYTPSTLKGIMFQTAGSASRSFSVDNLLVETAA